jgi:phospholipase C
MLPETAKPLGDIEHVVVLMLENRSFDNVLGWLYDPQNAPPFNNVPRGQTFNGVSCKGLTNPGPGGQSVPVGSTTDTTNPYPDPGEVYQDVYGQLYNVNPPPLVASDAPPDPPQPPSMTGFVNNYALQKGVTDPGNIMKGFRPPALPSVSALANSFVVCDNWFASVPSQTLTNRSFMHAGTASGYVNNDLHHLPLFVNDTPTIFNLMEAQRISWSIYYGSYWWLSMAFLNQKQLERFPFDFGPRRMFPFRQFLEDAQNGNLPSYAFIEPIFIDSCVYGRENDMHPDAAILDWDGKPSNAIFGDELVRKIYQALKASSLWNQTLLVILFDEHGGCYDHVAPGPATPPDGRIIAPGMPGASGFKFDRYGVRVPAILVSPLLVGGTVDHTLYDHTSILRTVMEQFGVSGDLGQRVANANPIVPPFADGPRSDVPDLTTPVAPNDTVEGDAPFHAVQAMLVRAAALRLSELNPAATPEPDELTTRLSSEAELQRAATAAGMGEPLPD